MAAREIPVYLFTGFLDGGKSTFVQSTLEDRRFNSGEKTLLIRCEDGEVEYDFSAFSGENVFLRAMEEEEEFNEDALKAAEDAGADAISLINTITGSDLKFEVKEGRVDVCQAIEEMRRESKSEGRMEGVDETRLESIRNIMVTLKLTAQQAMDALLIPAGERPKYTARL